MFLEQMLFMATTRDVSVYSAYKYMSAESSRKELNRPLSSLGARN